jgi:phosphoribosylaminoimidazole (AIR) synthetase
MSLLSAIKQSLRISTDNTDFDTEIADLISQAIDDLKASGVKPDVFNDYGSKDTDGNVVDSINDGNVRQAITLYVKSYFGIENPDKEWYIDRYQYKKSELCNQVSQYRVEVDTL